MESVVETQQPQPSDQTAPAAPAPESVEPSPKPETEGTEQQVETEETPQRRESRRARQLNRERERRIAAETELRLYREQQVKQQPPAVTDDEPQRDQFSSYEEFIEARATFKAEMAAEQRTRKVLEESRRKDSESSQRAAQEKAVSEWNAKIDRARDMVEDFDDVCSESDSPVTQPMAEAIQESDQGALIAYYLAKNPGEAERISKLSPSKQAAAIVGLEDKVARTAKQPSNAPAPINPVGRTADVDKDPAKMTDSEYAKWRRERIKQRR